MSDSKELGDRYRIERDSLRNEVDKLYDQVRHLKDEASMKYETYSKQINQTESQNEDKIRSLLRENERFKDENDTMRKQQQSN